jgi:hypothetical protein
MLSLISWFLDTVNDSITYSLLICINDAYGRSDHLFALEKIFELSSYTECVDDIAGRSIRWYN